MSILDRARVAMEDNYDDYDESYDPAEPTFDAPFSGPPGPRGGFNSSFGDDYQSGPGFRQGGGGGGGFGGGKY